MSDSIRVLGVIIAIAILVGGVGAFCYTMIGMINYEQQQNDIDIDTDDIIYNVTYKDNGNIKSVVGTIDETNTFTIITDVYGKTTKINNNFIISIVGVDR